MKEEDGTTTCRRKGYDKSDIQNSSGLCDYPLFVESSLGVGAGETFFQL